MEKINWIIAKARDKGVCLLGETNPKMYTLGAVFKISKTNEAKILLKDDCVPGQCLGLKAISKSKAKIVKNATIDPASDKLDRIKEACKFFVKYLGWIIYFRNPWQLIQV